ncbi:MAG: alpha/beta fold hydrolase [Acidimicrobiia bacterium]|nr:alpha/beta fold hydrolase [Acidimicrobiia bacterium]
MSAWKRATVAIGAIGAVAGIGVATERTVARRLRGRVTPNASPPIVAEYERSYRLPAHDGGEIFVVERGVGPVILLSHGVTLSVRTWANQLRDLADAGFRVVAFDHRGHGASTVGTSGHTIQNLGDDVRSVIEGMDLREVVIVGHSMGGIAVQALCIHHPEFARERLAGIVLLSTLARSVLAGNRRIGQATTWIADRLPDSAAALRARDLGLVITRLGFGRDPDPRAVEATRQMMLDTHPSTRREAVAALAHLDLTPHLNEIATPTMVMCGTADLVTPLGESRRIATRIPGARLEVFDGGGHMLMLEQAARLNTLLADFADQVQEHGRAADSVLDRAE